MSAAPIVPPIPCRLTGWFPPIRIYHGLEVQDGTTWWLLIGTSLPHKYPNYLHKPTTHSLFHLTEWETLEHHQTLMNDKVQYPILGSYIQKFSTGVKLWHASFPEAPYTAFEAPYTEIVTWSLKDGHKTKEEQAKVLEWAKTIVGNFNELPAESGVSKGTVGPVIEESEAATAITLGWTSPEVRISLRCCRDGWKLRIFVLGDRKGL